MSSGMGLAVLLLAAAAAAQLSPEAPVVRVNDTDVVGTVLLSARSRLYAAFRGIPYARPPLGGLRFQNPEPLELEPGTLNATEDGPMCIQKNVLAPGAVVLGQEDCLYLNVYTPDTTQKLPVLVYLHGGAWFGGSAVSYLTSPSLLMDQGVVVVTPNYRLGALGFLSTGDEQAPGNLGMKDQVLALRWVRDNVAAFGGDPGTVTIFGQSAGAGSVHLHMLSPMTRGLFQRAISNSGSAIAAWAFPTEDPLALAQRHARLVGCGNHSTSRDLVACLQAVDASRIVDTTEQLKVWSVDPLTLYRPVVEGYGRGADRFLPRAPLDVLRDALASPCGRHSFTRVPWLTGVVGDEGIIRAVPIVTNASLLSELNSRLDELMPELLELEGSAGAQADWVWRQVKRRYFGPDPVVIGDHNVDSFIQLYSDRSFNHAMHNAVVYQRMAGHKNIFVYSFEYRGMYSYTNVFANTTKNYGVSHCDDLLYLVPAPLIFPPFPDGKPEWEVADALLTLWTNFAKYGQPTPTVGRRRGLSRNGVCVNNVEDVVWPSSSDGGLVSYLQISADTSTRRDSVLKYCYRDDLLSERVGFWNKLPLAENILPRDNGTTAN